MSEANLPEEDAQESLIQRVNKVTSRQFESEDDVVQWADNANKAIGANKESKLAQDAKDFEEKTGKTPTEYLASQSQANADTPTLADATDTGEGSPVIDDVILNDMPIAELEEDYEDIVKSVI